MLGYVQIITLYLFFKYSLSRRGEACKDKIEAGKTPRRVSHFWIFGNVIYCLRAVLACAESDTEQC